MFSLGCTKHLTGCALPWGTPFYETPFARFGVEVPCRCRMTLSGLHRQTTIICTGQSMHRPKAYSYQVKHYLQTKQRKTLTRGHTKATSEKPGPGTHHTAHRSGKTLYTAAPAPSRCKPSGTRYQCAMNMQLCLSQFSTLISHRPFKLPSTWTWTCTLNQL